MVEKFDGLDLEEMGKVVICSLGLSATVSSEICRDDIVVSKTAENILIEGADSREGEVGRRSSFISRTSMISEVSESS